MGHRSDMGYPRVLQWCVRIFMERGYVAIGTPPGASAALPPVKFVIQYNCSNAATSCFGADCYTLFTAGIPLNATGCGASSAVSTECATPMFRWIKTLLPVPPHPVYFVSEGVVMVWRLENPVALVGPQAGPLPAVACSPALQSNKSTK